MNFYELSAKRMNGQTIKMEQYKGKLLLIVNTASRCGLTPQFKELEALYQAYHSKGLEILGFPCNQFANQDSGSNAEIVEFCQLNYGVSFTMFEKIKVNGRETHPIYCYLKQEAGGLFGRYIKWNFTKFLVDQEGRVIKRYAPTVKPSKIEKDIQSLI